MERDGYNQIYYWTNFLDDMLYILNNDIQYNTLPYIIEILYNKDDSVVKYIEKLSNFRYYGGVRRLTKKITIHDIEPEDDKNIVLCDSVDIESILKLHNTIFNKYIDKYMSKIQLEKYMENSNVYVYKMNNHVLGCLLYTICGRYAHLRYWYTDINVKNKPKGIGKALLNKLNKVIGENNFIEVWCRKDNNKAFEIYKKYGFHLDGLENDILIFAKNTYCIDKLIPLN